MANSDAIGLKDHDGTGGEVLADGFEVGKHERSDLGGATVALAAQQHDRRERSVRHGQQFTEVGIARQDYPLVLEGVREDLSIGCP